MNVVFAGGSMAHLIFFHKQVAHSATCLWKRLGIFYSAGGEIPQPNVGSPDTYQHW